MKKTILFFVLAAFFFTDCSRDYYQTAGYDELAIQHEVIAVLPTKTVTNGRIPPELTGEMILEIEENESKAFQIAMFDEISERSGPYEGDVRVTLQHYSETNALLERAGMTLRGSWDRPPSELAELLGVDAVVRTTVQKQLYLTELESFGIDFARSMMLIFDGPWWILNDKTSDVFASAAIIDGPSGVVVWSTEKKRSTDWNQPHAEIVRGIARVMARRFPYRE